MTIKKQTIIPAHIAITRCPDGIANATPLRVLRNQADIAAKEGFNNISLRANSETQYERKMEHFAACQSAGVSMSDLSVKS